MPASTNRNATQGRARGNSRTIAGSRSPPCDREQRQRPRRNARRRASARARSRREQQRSATSTSAEPGDPDRHERRLRHCAASRNTPSQRICAADSGRLPRAEPVTRRTRPTRCASLRRNIASAVSAARRCSRPWPAGSARPGSVQRERARNALRREHPRGEARDPLSPSSAAATHSRRARRDRRRRPRTASCASRRRARPLSTRPAAADRRAGSSRRPADRRVAVGRFA